MLSIKSFVSLLSASICNDFEYMKERALKSPEGTEEMMDMISYVEKARIEGIKMLGDRISESKRRMNYLLDVYFFTSEHIELNRTVLLWPGKIAPVFEQNDEVCSPFILLTTQCCESMKGFRGCGNIVMTVSAGSLAHVILFTQRADIMCSNVSRWWTSKDSVRTGVKIRVVLQRQCQYVLNLNITMSKFCGSLHLLQFFFWFY